MSIRHCPYCGEPIKPGDQVCSKTGKLLPFVTDVLSPGTTLHSRYEIQKLIHSGGMGYVYLAIDKRLQRQCVVKQVKEQVKSDAHLKKLEAEALQMAKLSHPNVAMVLDHFVEDNYYYLVVEYIEGKTLSQIYEERGVLEESEVVKWARDICDVVSYLHRKGAIHRDISPDNVMFTEEGHIKLVDFGTMRGLREIAAGKASKEGKFGFTPPEQWQGKPVPQSDIFAIGATIYYLLTGYLPLSDEYRDKGEPQPSDYSPDYPPIRVKNPAITAELQKILSKALSLVADNRYPSADDLKQALESYEYQQAKQPVKPSASGYQQEIPRVKPILGVDKPRIDFGSLIPGTPSVKHFTIQNLGAGILMGKLTAGESWIQVFPTIIDFEGDKKDIIVTVDTARLPRNFDGKGYIDIETNGGNTRIEVRANRKQQQTPRRGWIVAGSILAGIAAVVLIARAFSSAPPPVLDVDTSTIYLENIELSTISDTKTITINNTGGQTLICTLTTDRNWLQVYPTTLEVDGNAGTRKVVVRVNTTGLNYKFSDTGYIIIKSNGGDKQIPVKLTTLIFEDDFSNPNSGWWVGSTAESEAEYLDGKYRYLNKQSGYYRWNWNEKVGQLDDFVLEVDAQWYILSSSYNYYGVTFRAQDEDNHYVFFVSSDDSQYVVGKDVKGTWSTLKGWTESTYIKKGTAVNRLKVVCQGSQISVYVNGYLLATFSDSSLSKGRVGLAVGKGKSTSIFTIVPDADALFDNLKISWP